jgi:hypothetical protein
MFIEEYLIPGCVRDANCNAILEDDNKVAKILVEKKKFATETEALNALEKNPKLKSIVVYPIANKEDFYDALIDFVQ